MEKQWESKKLYEHPVEHRKGTWGKVVLSEAGVYGMMVGFVWMSCPPDWAAKIHAAETQSQK